MLVNLGTGKRKDAAKGRPPPLPERRRIHRRRSASGQSARSANCQTRRTSDRTPQAPNAPSPPPQTRARLDVLFGMLTSFFIFPLSLLQEKPTDLPGKQAMAAIGMVRLMRMYDDFFTSVSQPIAQVSHGAVLTVIRSLL